MEIYTIKKASSNDSKILAQMARKIWNNDSVEELEKSLMSSQ